MALSRPEDALLQEMEALAVRLAQEAGGLLLDRFGQRLAVDFKEKGHRAPVTEADRLAEEVLRRGIAARFPDHSMVGEEQAPLERPGPFVWVLDPLDGTTNYVNGLPFFAVSIGVLWQGRPVVGAIYLSAGHCGRAGVYHARQGGGAYLDGERLAPAQGPERARLAVLPARLRRALRRHEALAWESRTLGSIASELAYVASGVFQYAYFGAPRAWDVAAGLVLLRESGRSAYAFRQGPPERGASATARGPRRWAPLEQLPYLEGSPALQRLQEWSAPVLAGEPAAVELVVRQLERRFSPWAVLVGWLRRWRRGRQEPEPGRRTGGTS